MSNEMQRRFAQFAAVEKLTALLQSCKDNAAQARKGWKARNATMWASVRDEAEKQLAALVPDLATPKIVEAPVNELPLAQKGAK